MECTVTWTGAAGTRSGMGFVAETGSGHIVNMDGAPDAAKPEYGGQNLAPRPMEMLLAGTPLAVTVKCMLILVKTLGSTSARSLLILTLQPRTS